MNGILITLIPGVFILVGMIIIRIMKNTHLVEQISVSLALGAMVGLSIFELVPESFEGLSETLPTVASIFVIIGAVLVGAGLLKILDHFIPDHDDDHSFDHHCSDENTMHVGIMTCIALVLHNLIEGMAVYSVAARETLPGLLVALTVGLHNIPMGMMIYSTLRKEGKGMKVVITLLLTLSTFVGGVIMALFFGIISELVVSILIAITLGMLIYIIVFELLPHILHGHKKWLSFLCAALGLVLVFVCTFAE